MSKPKYVMFVENIENVLNTFDRDFIKSAIGDSINNNRTLTVSQVIRFLSTRRNSTLKSLADQLEAVYGSSVVHNSLLRARANTFRTDAIDINELLNAVSVNSRSVSRSLSAA